MPEKTEAQKRAQKNYMDRFSVARVRMEKAITNWYNLTPLPKAKASTDLLTG